MNKIIFVVLISGFLLQSHLVSSYENNIDSVTPINEINDVKQLEKYINSGDEVAILNAISRLGELGRNERIDAINTLKKYWKISAKETRDELLNDPSIRIEIAHQLILNNVSKQEMYDYIFSFVNDERFNIKLAMINALFDIDTNRASLYLAEHIDDKNKIISFNAYNALIEKIYIKREDLCFLKTVLMDKKNIATDQITKYRIDKILTHLRETCQKEI